MSMFENFSSLFLEVWKQGILGVDIFQILIGLGIFLIFLFRKNVTKVCSSLKRLFQNKAYEKQRRKIFFKMN